MVEKEMVGAASDPFIKAVSEAVKRLEASDGPLYAALLAHLPDRPADDWIFLAGSSKLAKRRLDGIHAIVKAMRGTIPNRYSTRIRRVDVLRTDDPVYLKLSRAFKLSAGASAELISCNVFGLEIEHAVLFAMTAAVSHHRSARSKKRNSRDRVARA